MLTLQMFLQQLIPAMEQGTALLTPLMVFLAILHTLENGSFLKTCTKAAYWGFWATIFFMAVKEGTRNAVSREVFECGMAFFALVTEILILFMLRKSIETVAGPKKLFKGAAVVMTIALFMYYGMEIWLIPITTFRNVETFLSIEFLVRILGFAVGLLIAGLGSWFIYHASKALRDRRLYVVFFIQALALFFQQIIYIVQILMARQILPMKGLIHIMAPFIDHQSWFIFAVYIVVFMAPIALFLQKRPERPEGANPAQYRKLLANDMHKKRWVKASVVILAVMLFFSTAGSAYANKKEVLIPAVPVDAVNGMVKIPLTKVNDGHLHRFSFHTKDGTTVRFIVVLKGGSAYGVGLDACEICGETGYIEREGQIVCKLCDVVMNKNTIGMKGGCNPIPLAYNVGDGALQVESKDLDAASKIFR